MDLFILDDQLRRTAVVDRFESCIWTERYSSSGDFQLNIHSDLNSRTLFQPGVRLAINESTRVMEVETVIDKLDDERRSLLEVKGPSLESILLERTARDVVTGGVPQMKWVFTDTLPAEIPRIIFEQICVDLTIDPGDFIPFYVPGNIYPTDTNPEPEDTVSLEISITSVYQAIKEICDIYGLGFRLVRNGDTSELTFNIYPGNDRTTLQSTLTPVIFAPELDNLQDISYLISQNGAKNVAYVYSPDGTAFAYSLDVDPSISGFQRHVLNVEASDILYLDRAEITPAPYTVSAAQQAAVNVAQNLTTTTQFQRDSLGKISKMERLYPQDIVNINTVLTLVGTTLTAPQIADITAARNTSTAYNATEDAELQVRLIARGKDALATATPQAAFDGEVPKTSQYIYGRDYQLGDIVEIRNADKVANQMRVVEQIFVSDREGDRAYPTLAVKQLISAGSWYAEPPAEVWEDLGDTDYWGTRP